MKWLAFIISVLIALPCFPQSSNSTKQDDSKFERNAAAMEVLTLAVNAMGGNAVTNIVTTEIRGHVIKNGTNSVSRAFDTKYKVTTSAIYFRKEITTERGTILFASGGGRAVFTTPSGKSHRYGHHVAQAALPIDVPALLLSFALNKAKYKISLIDAGSTTIPIHIRLEDRTNAETAAVTTQDWYFAPDTSLPIRVEYKLPDVVNETFWSKAICDYMEFQAVQGVLIPKTIYVFEDNKKSGQISIEAADFNLQYADNFDMREGGEQ